MSDWGTFRKNLILFAPTKGEAKKTVSKGLVRLEFGVAAENEIVIEGTATDDITSIYMVADLSVQAAARLLKPALLKSILKNDVVGYWTPDQLRSEVLEPPAQPKDDDFDKRFWVEHVLGSIHLDAATQLASSGVSFNPDRMRKLALMEPRGQLLEFWFCEWADRSIIRWYTETARGAYAPVGMW